MSSRMSRHSVRRNFLCLPLVLSVTTALVSGACNSTKPKAYTPPATSQARCTESHSADGTCAAAEAAEE